MKFIFLILLLQTSAFALNQTFLRMPPNKEYMNFAMKKYLGWHRQNFKFPENSALLNSLIEKVDNWTVGSPYLRQITITHFVRSNEEIGFKIRLFVHPELRSNKEFSGKGLPVKKELMFVEWDNQNSFCQIFRETPDSYSSWCKERNGTYTLSSQETIQEKLPPGWTLPFPVLGEAVIEKKISNQVDEIFFFEVTPHPSIIPKPLLRSVFLHTKETLFPLDRMSNTRDGKIGIHYP